MEEKKAELASCDSLLRSCSARVRFDNMISGDWRAAYKTSLHIVEDAA